MARDVVRERWCITVTRAARQYTALSFTQRLVDAGVDPSTGSVGDSYDDAMAESLFSKIKGELIYRQRWASRHDAELAIFSYIQGFYNPERIQDALGMLSPDEFEALHLTGHRPVGAPGTVFTRTGGMAPQALPEVAVEAVTL